jgi:hypothetical protein
VTERFIGSRISVDTKNCIPFVTPEHQQPFPVGNLLEKKHRMRKADAQA